MSNRSLKTHSLVAGLLAALGWSLAAPAAAVPLPAVGASASATAMTPGQDSGTLSDAGNPLASVTNAASGTGDADAFAEATVGGSLRSSAVVESASGSGSSSTAEAAARWVGRFQAGGIDPAGPIDLDLDITLDGSLFYQNNNTNVDPGGLVATVIFRITLHDMASGASVAFDGSAAIDAVSRTVPPDFVRTGSWADASRDGDFSVGGCSAFSCDVDVAAAFSIDDALLVAFGSDFGVEVELIAQAFQAQGRETGAGSDFASTGSVSLSTDTPGVSFAAVPEAGLGLLPGSGLIALALPRRRRAA